MARSPKTGEQAPAASGLDSDSIPSPLPADAESHSAEGAEPTAAESADRPPPAAKPLAAPDQGFPQEVSVPEDIFAEDVPLVVDKLSVAPGDEEDSEAPTLPQTFDELDLPDAIRTAVAAMGWTKPTPVQSITFPVMIEGRDVLVQSHTGSGKTGAFCLPWLAQRFDPGDAAQTGVQLLVLTPTRELAKQVCDQLQQMARDTEVRTLPIYGGTAMQPQLQALNDGVHAVVGTPGRILDHIRRRSLKLDRVRMAVLDEADEMLSMGFLEDIHAILDACATERQTCLFSATVPPDIERIARRYMQNPESVMLSGDQVAASQIDHVYYQVSGTIKVRDLLDMIAIEEPANALVFCNTREETYVVASALCREGYQAEPLSSDLTQTAREGVMGRMRSGQLRFLVATDVASRGIDISHIGHVINYSFPENAESYVHRTGRTGRAGRPGLAISLIAPQELGNHYYLKLQYPSIKFEERSLPPAEELAHQRLETKIDRISRLFPDLVAPEWTLLTRHLVSDPRGEQVVAYLLKDAMTRVNQARDGRSDTRRSPDSEPRRGRGRDAESSYGRGGRGRSEREARPRHARDDGHGDRTGDEPYRDQTDPDARESGESNGPVRTSGRSMQSRGRRSRSSRNESTQSRPSLDQAEGLDARSPHEQSRQNDDESRGRRRRRGRSSSGSTVEESTEPSDATASSAAHESSDGSTDGGPTRDAPSGENRRRRRRSPRTTRPSSSESESVEPIAAAPDEAHPAQPIEALDASQPEHAPDEAESATEPREGSRRRRRRGRRSSVPAHQAVSDPATETTDALAPPPSSAFVGDHVELDDTVGLNDDPAIVEFDAQTVVTNESFETVTDPGTITGVRSRRRRRRRRRGRSDQDQGPARKDRDEADPSEAESSPRLTDNDDRSTAAKSSGDDSEEGRRRRRRRRGGGRRRSRDSEGHSAAASTAPTPVHVSQDQIIIDIDESELEVVRDQFGEVDELDDLTLKGRRRGVMDDLQDEVELEDLSEADRAREQRSGDDSDDSDDSDDADDSRSPDASDDEESARPGDGSSDASEADPREEKKRRRRRRRRRKKAPAPPPELAAPPHKDFWEVWAGKFTYKDFEDDTYLGGTAAVPEEPEPPAAPPPMPSVDDEDTFVRVRLNIGRKHGKKAAHVRELLAETFGLTRKAVRDLTVGEASSRFRLGLNALTKLESLVVGFIIDGLELAVTRLDPPSEPTSPASTPPPLAESPREEGPTVPDHEPAVAANVTSDADPESEQSAAT